MLINDSERKICNGKKNESKITISFENKKKKSLKQKRTNRRKKWGHFLSFGKQEQN